MSQRVAVFDGIPEETPLRVTRGDTARHYFSVWYVDSRGRLVEPYDLTGYSFVMQVRLFERAEEVLIDVPESGFEITQDELAAEWEEEKGDKAGRNNHLAVIIPKELTKTRAGEWVYDVEFYPPNGEQKFTYAGGPYIVGDDTARNNG